jgi:hypothetical protein
MRSSRSLTAALLVLLLTVGPVSVLHAQSDTDVTPVDDAAPSVVVSPDQPADVTPVDVAVAFPAQRTKTTGCLSSGGLPDAACTPGRLDARVTQANVASTICVSGYTATVRPSTRITEPIKVQQMAAYGLADQSLADEELDHLIPLELGGATDVANLWPEPWTGPTSAREKDKLENFLHGQVCSGALALADAQHAIVSDWYAVYLTLAVGAPGSPAADPSTAISQPRPVSPGAGTQDLAFVSVVGAPHGGSASVTIQTTPGANCSVQYVTPAGTTSTAKGQGSSAATTTGPDGRASWSWVIAPSTNTGTGSVTVNCSTGTVAAPIAIS